MTASCYQNLGDDDPAQLLADDYGGPLRRITSIMFTSAAFGRPTRGAPCNIK